MYFKRLTFCFLLLQQLYAQSEYVNPFVGTGGHGHTFPGATLPFGMVQLSPDTRIDGSWDGCSGYHYSDSLIYGFSHTHLSGTGVSDYGDILLTPMTHAPAFDAQQDAVSFRHTNEQAGAGWYTVLLDNGVKTELTATTRVGIHQYTFPSKGLHGLLLNLAHRDEVTDASVRSVSSTLFIGHRHSKGWARDQQLYFAIEFSSPVSTWNLYQDGNIFQTAVPEKDYQGKDLRLFFAFTTSKPLIVKVGISQVSAEGALKNLQTEAPGWDFEKYRNDARAVWNQELSRIQVTTKNIAQKKVFYTALYHCFIHPNVASDVDGTYRGMDRQVHTAEGYTRYSVFSLWDTFRSLHPLFTLVQRKRTEDFIATFLAMYREGGKLPVWELAGNETDCMIGYHSVSVLADALAKGIPFDLKSALEAALGSVTVNGRGNSVYARQGYLGADDEPESVSKTLEYAYDDWCIAQLALAAGDTACADSFLRRSEGWKHLFDPVTGLLRPRRNGGWVMPFDPREVNNNYTEANGWQYNFFVPHGMAEYIRMLGGAGRLKTQLDKLFSEPPVTTGREQVDITGLIGQYAHGNEPSHHVAWLYFLAGCPDQTRGKVQPILTTFYQNTPDGLIGNEDCGQMSAWYVMSAIGLYPVCPGTPELFVMPPLFDAVSIHLENGKSIEINGLPMNKRKPQVANISWETPSGMTLNTSGILDQGSLQDGGKLVFSYTSDLTSGYGNVQDVPFRNAMVLPAPVFLNPAPVFRDSVEVEILDYDPGATVYYCNLHGGTQGPVQPYTGRFRLYQSDTILAWTEGHGLRSPAVTCRLHRFPNNWKVNIDGKYNPQYTAGGDDGIIDGLRGPLEWRKGGWQGYQGQNVTITIDLLAQQEIHEVVAGFLQDSRAWILMPSGVEFSFSQDGNTWETPWIFRNEGDWNKEQWDRMEEFNPYKETYSVDPKDEMVQVHMIGRSWKEGQNARYIRVQVQYFGPLPEWHAGFPYQGESFFFLDEILVK